MLTSSGQLLIRRRTVRKCTSFIFLSLVVAWNIAIAYAQSAIHTSTKSTTNSVHQPHTETSYEFSRPTFGRAKKYIQEKVQHYQNRRAPDSNIQPNTRQDNAEAHPSQEHIRTEHEAKHSVGHVQNQFDHSQRSSHTFRQSLNFACEAAQDVWRMLNPSTHSFPQPDEQTEGDAVSVDEALEHIRGIIHILGRAHNALLEKKLANLPLFQKLWLKYLHFYKDPSFAQNKDGQRAKFRKALSPFALAARDFDSIFRNSDAIKKNANALMGTFAKEILQFVSALKQSVRKAARGGWLMTPDARTYIEEVMQSFNTLSEKWSHKMASLAESTRPISDKMPSHKQVQQLVKEFENMITEFKKEVWRSRTEWMYQRGEALSWAKDKIHDLKRRAGYKFDRIFEILNVHAQSAKQMVKGSLERSKEVLVNLRVRLTEFAERLSTPLRLWFISVAGFLGNCHRLLVLCIFYSWRIFAFIVVIILFRFLMGFVLADNYVRSALVRTISRLDANDSTNPGLETAKDGHLETLPSGSPSKSETSESGPKRKSSSPERRSPPNISKPSRVRDSTSPEHNKLVKPRVQRRERRTVAKVGNNRPQKQTTPLQVSNLHCQNTLTSLEKQMNGRPIHLGDHEVQLVYEDIPRDGATDAQRNDAGRKSTSGATKTAGLQRSSRRGQKQPGVNSSTESNDDVITVNSSDESTTSYGSARSRLTRASLRRASSRRSQAH